jgi:ornithine carbamoyltransferase
MNPPIQPLHASAAAPPPPAPPRLPLRGRKLCLMAEDADSEAARLFRQAATGLGAHVAHVRPSLSELSTPQELRDTARMLGRLYDAIECQGMAAAVVRQLANEAGVVVFEGLAVRPDDDATSPDERSSRVQAGLMRTLGLG